MIIMLFLRVLARKSLFIFTEKVAMLVKVSLKRFQITYANLLIFLKQNFEVSVLCFALNGTLGDL